MSRTVGAIFLAMTDRAKFRDATPKYHLCVCGSTCQYLYVCSDQYNGDYPLQQADCSGLPKETSFISLRTILFVGRFKAGWEQTCQLSDEYLRGLFEFVKVSRVMMPKDKTKVLVGLATHLNLPPP